MPIIQTLPLASSVAGPGNRTSRQLLVAGPDVFVVYPLPQVGSLEIGRSELAQLRLGDVGASRQHATLHVDERVCIEDNGSVNGTFVRGQQIAPRQPVPVQPGDAIQIGATLLVLQQRSEPLKNVRLWPHVHFEARVQDECRRARDAAGTFAVVRLAVDDLVATDSLTDALNLVLEWEDAVSACGPGEWEVLLAMRSEAALDDAIESVVVAFEQVCARADSVVVRFPEDGLTSDSLIGKARDRLHLGQEPAATDVAVIFDPAMRTLYDVAARVAAADISVLVLGETGVGKDVLARTIHKRSPRAGFPFVSLNCAALSETLLESELFGHEKGAFTGATSTRIGLLESAQGGTVFLDEVGEMSATMQAKLLRALENKEITRLGSVQSRSINVRFIAATNRDLEAESDTGRFRKDLYFRIASMTLSIPPLRSRPTEILPLAELFLRDVAHRTDRPVPTISVEAALLLSNYAWPGNIRELRNVIERAMVFCAGSEIQTQHLPVEKLDPARISQKADSKGSTVESVARERARIGDDELSRITQALGEAGGNQTRAARILGMPRRTLIRRLEAYGIIRPQKLGE